MEFTLELNRNDVQDLDTTSDYQTSTKQDMEFAGKWHAVSGSNSWDYDISATLNVQSSVNFPQPVLEVGKNYKITIEEVP